MRVARHALGSLAVFALLGCATPAEPAAPAAHAELEEQALRLVNAHRVGRGLTRLAPDTDLAALARIHSAAMARRGKLDHAGIEERHIEAEHSGPAARFAENVMLALGTETKPAEAAVGRWLESDLHLVHIEGRYERTGMGVARGDEGVYYFTQLFAGSEP